MKIPAMTATGRRRGSAVVLAIALGVLGAPVAWAQIGSGPVGTTGKAGRVQAAPEKPPEPAPDAIPGAKPRIAAAPATRPAGDMEPTDALFDAINRGDIASARDALSRGADLNGTDVLGMTPMELSVDLGRNDISFLLLSMRGEDSNRGSRALGRDTPPSEPAIRADRAGKAAGQARGQTGPGKAEKVANPPVASRPIAKPKLFANDGGAPVPSAGFLGFDMRSASN